MKGLRHHIRNFFGFSRAQTNGLVLLLAVAMLALFSKPVYHSWVSSRQPDFSKETKTLDSLTAIWESAMEEQNSIPIEDEIAVVMFPFNPNSVTADELKILGFSDRLSKGLQNYRAAGGSFRIKSDLKKLYGMDSAFYKNIYPFILLPEEVKSEKQPLKYTRAEKEIEKFNLNEADSTQLQRVYGIGPVLARRIVKYRERLGGFVSVNQLKEVYGLDSLVIQKLVMASFLSPGFAPNTININTADEKTLTVHPYFSKRLAQAIVTYRFQHGNFQSVDDLRKIQLMNEPTILKILPYVAVE